MNPEHEDLWECPGEAHELDNTFNPSSQDAYGPGYHDCDLCDNTGEVTLDEYIAEMEWRKEYAQLQEEAKLVRFLKNVPPKCDIVSTY